MKDDKKTKTIALCVTAQDHKIIKIEAAKRDMTIKEFIMTALKKYLIER